MTKKVKPRFEYLNQPVSDKTEADEQHAPFEKLEQNELQTVPRGQGRMEQDRTQLNIRVPTMLKRRAAAQAMLKGESLGDVIEEFLRMYIED